MVCLGPFTCSAKQGLDNCSHSIMDCWKIDEIVVLCKLPEVFGACECQTSTT